MEARLVNDSAVVLDLDGTLLNSEKQVSGRSLRATLRLHQQGVKIIFATAVRRGLLSSSYRRSCWKSDCLSTTTGL